MARRAITSASAASKDFSNSAIRAFNELISFNNM